MCLLAVASTYGKTTTREMRKCVGRNYECHTCKEKAFTCVFVFVCVFVQQQQQHSGIVCIKGDELSATTQEAYLWGAPRCATLVLLYTEREGDGVRAAHMWRSRVPVFVHIHNAAAWGRGIINSFVRFTQAHRDKSTPLRLPSLPYHVMSWPHGTTRPAFANRRRLTA